GLLQRRRHLDETRAVAAERWIELDGHDPLPGRERARQPCLAPLLAERDDELGRVEDERRARLALFFHRRADGGDLRRRCPAAAADDLRTELARMRRELGEVL